MKISILGAGSWGLALAQVLNDNNNDVLIYARREEVVTEINSQHTNKKYFPSVIFSEKIKATFNLKEAVQFADILLIAVPVKAYRSLLLEVKDYLLENLKNYNNFNISWSNNWYSGSFPFIIISK